jgi:gliding motility-associated-like protein
MLNDRLITLLKNDLLPLTDTGNYCIRLIAISDGGCSDTSQQCIYVFENAFVMPNAFTPNDDGRNDRFYPVLINSNNTAVSAFSIYDRWGQKLFDDPSQGWDGKYKGQLQPGGVYTYFITVNLADAQHPGQMREIHRQGSLTLIRWLFILSFVLPL